MSIEFLPYLLLLLAVLTGWLMATRISILILAIAVAAGLTTGRLAPIAVVWIALSGLSIWLPTNSRLPRGGLIFCYAVFLGLATAMSTHLLPGFHNLPIYQDARFSPDSIPFTMYLNFDQTVAGLFLYLFFLKPRETARFGKAEWLTSLKILGLLSALILSAVFLIGYVRVDLKFPELGWIWILNNLFFVCLSEEALFRGFLQKGLVTGFTQTKTPAVIAVVLASVLFGLAHHQGGVPLIGLATVSGLFFGYAYYRTNRIESPILVHFGLNLIHFVFFSYPALG